MSPADPPIPADPTTPRVLLFGHRGAGKSALIGALLQAGATQGETLRGEVVHSSVDLPRIRDAVYSGTPIEPSQRELVSYTIRLRPWRAGTQALIDPLTVVLDDCDGKAAESLLEDPEPITRRAPDSPVAQAVAGADAIVLLVDAASTDVELTEAFTEFKTFLEVVGRAKTDAREVGGFPVFLVLTQCDRLARPGDTERSWEERVRHRAEAAWAAFDAFLKDADDHDEAPAPFLPFGSVHLDVLAVAVRRPPLPGVLSPHSQPYQVAELFRDCFAQAKAHRARARASDPRLKWTTRLALTAVAALVTGFAVVALFPPQPSGPALAEKVRAYERFEPPAAARLADDQIERNKTALLRFKLDGDYPDLPADLRAFVESRIKEIEDYEAFRGQLAATPAPASARNLPDLYKIRATLTGALDLPPEYAWGETAAAVLRRKWLADIDAIVKAESDMVAYYRKYDTEATALLLARAFDAGWLARIATLTEEGDRPPFPLKSPVPNSPTVNQPRGEPVPYSVPYEFDEVYHVRRGWQQARDRLARLRDLADALGATTPPTRPAAVLMLPEPDGVDSTSLAVERLAALRETYPELAEDSSEWEVQNFPDPARTELTTRLQKSFANGVQHVRKLMKVQDTKEGWKALAGTLKEPTYREWGQFLQLLDRLQNPSAPDPVTALAHFLSDLDTKAFELDLRGFELTVPLDLTVGLDRVEPVGPLTLTLTHGQTAPVTVKFNVGKGDTHDNVTVYRLTPEGSAKLAYHAGDDLRAELPVRAGTQALALRWDNGVSNTFRFDRLAREPRLTKPTGGTEPATGVKLVPTSGSTVPRFPALMPLTAK